MSNILKHADQIINERSEEKERQYGPFMELSLIHIYAMKTSKYFKPEEFERCNPSCSIEDMDQDFRDLLDDLREKAVIPLVLNCAYRSKEHDKAKGRSGNSAHTEGLAVDIRPVRS